MLRLAGAFREVIRTSIGLLPDGLLTTRTAFDPPFLHVTMYATHAVSFLMQLYPAPSRNGVPGIVNSQL